MKRHDLKPRPRPCPCGGMITPHKGEKRSKFEGRKYCCNTCPALNATKSDGSRIKAAIERKRERAARIPATNRNPVDMFLMGRL